MASVILDYSQNFDKVETIAQLRTYPLIGVRHGDTLLVVGSTTIADGGGGIYVWNEDSELEDNGGQVVAPADPTISGRWIGIAFASGIIEPPVFTYSVPLGFTTPPIPDEVLLIHVFSKRVVFPVNWVGATSRIGVSPAGQVTLSIRKNGGSVGSITISSSGLVNYSSTTPITFEIGDWIEVVAPTISDTTFSFSGFTLLGTVVEE